VQFNIERGYETKRVRVMLLAAAHTLFQIIALLRKLDADVVSLQEIDIGCERSGNVDTGLVIAQALGLNYLFSCEVGCPLSFCHCLLTVSTAGRPVRGALVSAARRAAGRRRRARQRHPEQVRLCRVARRQDALPPVRLCALAASPSLCLRTVLTRLFSCA
jgi:hypothetical protein